MRILTESDVTACLGIAEALDIVRDALREQSQGRVDSPARAEIRSPADGMLGLFMPAHVPGFKAFGQKTVSEFASNRDRGLPVLTAFLTLHDYETGLLDCVMGATYLTNVRTAALAGVAAAELAPSARVATVMGTGGLAPALVAGLAGALDVSEVRIWGRRPDQARKVVEDAAAFELAEDLQLVAVEDAEAAVRGADVVVTATSAREPIVSSSWVSDRTLLCAMGSNAPDMRELPTDLMSRATAVIVDTFAGVVGRAGEIVASVEEGVLAEEDIRELGDVLAGSTAPSIRTDGVTVFKSCGFAALDVAIGAAVLRCAEAQGLGQSAELGQDE